MALSGHGEQGGEQLRGGKILSILLVLQTPAEERETGRRWVRKEGWSEGRTERERRRKHRWLIVWINTIDTQLVWSRLCIEWGMKCNKIENLSGKCNAIMMFPHQSHLQNSHPAWFDEGHTLLLFIFQWKGCGATLAAIKRPWLLKRCMVILSGVRCLTFISWCLKKNTHTSPSNSSQLVAVQIFKIVFCVMVPFSLDVVFKRRSDAY